VRRGLAERDEVVIERALDQRPQVAAHPDVGFEAASRGAVEAQGMVGVGRDDVVDIGAEDQPPAVLFGLGRHLDGDERRIVDPDPDPFDRGHQHVTLGVLTQDRGEQLDQRRPADRRSAIEPRPVSGDAHVDFAAIGRIPKVNRRRAAAVRRGGGEPGKRAVRRRRSRHNLALVCGQQPRPCVTPRGRRAPLI
jgi:hypothetical protein